MEPNALLITLICFAALAAAYVIYGRFLARRIFQLDARRRTPAHEREDGVDFVPTRVPILFGHHFASIAGLGPILGPAIAVTWGWLPAILWVIVGCILLGAVHDLGALTVSLRFRGRSVGDVCRELVGPRARLLFLVVIFFLMSLAMGAFVNAITSLFLQFYPDAILPSLGLMLIAVTVGVLVYRRGIGLGPTTAVALLAFGVLIWVGGLFPVPTYDWFTTPQTQKAVAAAREKDDLKAPYGAAAAIDHFDKAGQKEVAADLRAAVGERGSLGSAQVTWIVVLLLYGFVASVLPVWLLLQPRDYINSFQLYFALAFIVLGLVVAALPGSSHADANVIHAPAIRHELPENTPPMIPILFVTIACGAISGFHSLVSSGTTVRQLNRETDALPIGFGAMLTEGALAVLVIMACVAGIGASAWAPNGIYGVNSKAMGGLGAPISALVSGGANFLKAIGIPVAFGQTFLAVTVVAFALTTLDSATRLLRFNVEEIFRSVKLDALANRYVASFIAVCGIAAFALVPAGRTLWTLFGTTNQLLAGLTLLTVSLFLFKLGRPILYTVIPMVLMLTMTIAAMLVKLVGALQEDEKSWWLISVSLFVLALSFWLIVEGILSFRRGREGFSIPGDDVPDTEHDMDAAASKAHLG